MLRWAPEYKLTLRQLEDYWTTFGGIHAPEGGCGDAFEIVEDTTAIYERQSESMGQPTDAQFWAVEAAPKTFEYLSKSPLVMYGPVEVLHAAASDADGTLAFEVLPFVGTFAPPPHSRTRKYDCRTAPSAMSLAWVHITRRVPCWWMCGQ